MLQYYKTECAACKKLKKGRCNRQYIQCNKHSQRT